ncbi:MAG TPA: acyl-CoA dehydrogenase [Nitriliruptorales bacterium]
MSNAERQEFQQVLRGLFAEVADDGTVRLLMAGTEGYDRSTWKDLAGGSRVVALGVPEALGGDGGELADLAVLFEEAGRALLPAPLLSTTLAVGVVLEVADRGGDLLGDLLGGSRTAAVVLPADILDDGGPIEVADAGDGAMRLTGERRYVLDGATADVLLVVAGNGETADVFAVDAASAGVSLTAVAATDQTRKLTSVRLDAAAGTALGAPSAAVARALDRARVLLAAEAVGVAQRCLEDMTAYARERIAFGRPIGSFQAVKHRCARALVRVEHARSLVELAAEHGPGSAGERPDAARLARLALGFAADAALHVAGSSIQVHGGIGFTWDHTAHLYYKRALVTRRLLGRSGDLLAQAAGDLAALRATIAQTTRPQAGPGAAGPASGLAGLDLVDERLDELFASADPKDPVAFWRRQYELGLTQVDLPEGIGGLGLDHRLQAVVESRLVDQAAPRIGQHSFMALAMFSPVIARHGTPEQHRRLLEPALTGQELWCQLFSEPGAGSDLAGLSTRAVPDGDGWVINGQKVWTSNAHVAQRGLIITRTDPDAPKHRGLTAFAVDMSAPGIEIRPLRQMTGHAEFNEVFLDDVRVDDADRIGPEGGGWAVAVDTLAVERSTADGDEGDDVRLASVDGLLRALGTGPHRDRDRARARVETLVVAWFAHLATVARASRSAQQALPGPEASLTKLVWSELLQGSTELIEELTGPEVLAHDYEQPPLMSGGDPVGDLLFARSPTIYSGTSEIQLNIIGERVLGLPGEPRVDKSVPWRDVPRN